MSENQFIRHLKGEGTAKSLLEVKNQSTPTTFANMPNGTSDANTVYSDHRGNATGVLKGAENWKINGSALVESSTIYGDGRDFIDSYRVFGNSVWVDATFTLASAKRFLANTKFVLKLCGSKLESVIEDTIGFTLIVNLGNNTTITKTFQVTEQAFDFCKEFVIDFAESNTSAVKLDAADTIKVQLVCADATASATIYNGMSVFTALQRRVDSDAISSDTVTLDELEENFNQFVIDTQEALDEKVNIDGSSVMTGPLKMADGSMRGAFSPYLNGVGFWKMDTQGNLTQIATLSDTQFLPSATNAIDFGSSTKRWKNLYLSGTEYIENNYGIRFAGTSSSNYFSIHTNQEELRIEHKYGSYDAILSFRAYTGDVVLYPHNDDRAIFGLPTRKWNRIYSTHLCSDSAGINLIEVPNKAGIMALMSDVELAANSGRMITDEGVWYAKMDAAGTIPSYAEVENRNYADFTQTNQDGDPIIVIYTYTSGVWTETETITPPAQYDGYVPVTSKIWDIAEQTGQQGGRILWNHQTKTFTPYPLIISTDNMNITNSSFQGDATLSGESTVVMPATPTPQQIVNKDYVDSVANPSKYATNCITEIPQDIKVEVFADSGQKKLKIKAGSKFTVPNGVGNFYTYTLQSDFIWGSTEVRNWVLAWDLDNNVIFANYKTTGQSGTSVPSNHYGFFYHTDTNYLYDYRNGVQNCRCSFPLIELSSNTSGVISIDNVFNGFGYIGSTIFALPGVKGLIPDGRNKDGSLKNIEISITDVKTYTQQSNLAVPHLITITSDGSLEEWDWVYYIGYNEQENIVFDKNGSASATMGNKLYMLTAGIAYHNNSPRIESFTPKTVFHALDYNDSEYIANCAMPSNKYIDLTLGASGSQYTAPADGYFQWVGATNATNGYFRGYNTDTNIGLETFNNNNGYGLIGFVPVRKGSVFGVSYQRVNITSFRFVYANGSK